MRVLVTILLLLSFTCFADDSLLLDQDPGKTKIYHNKISNRDILTVRLSEYSDLKKLELTAELDQIEVESIIIKYMDKENDYIREPLAKILCLSLFFA